MLKVHHIVERLEALAVTEDQTVHMEFDGRIVPVLGVVLINGKVTLLADNFGNYLCSTAPSNRG